MNTYSFRFILATLPNITLLAEQLFPKFEGDALPTISNEVASIHFDLTAHSLDKALKIALEGCHAIGLEIKHIELLPEEAFGFETA